MSLEDKIHNPQAKRYRAIARDMVTVDYKDDHGNPLSFPVSHSADNPPTPDDLFRVLDAVDFDQTKRELHALFGEDTTPPENQIGKWLKYLASEYTVRVAWARALMSTRCILSQPARSFPARVWFAPLLPPPLITSSA